LIPLINEGNGTGPNGSKFVSDKSEAELRLLDNKRVLIGTCDGNRFTIYVSKDFAAKITERDVKTIAGRVETTLRVVAEQAGNTLR
jgi:hypothetical protein